MSNNQKIITHTSKDHVDVVLDAKSEVVLVLLREGRQVNISVREVDTLTGGDEAVVSRLDLDSLLVHNLKNLKSQDTVVDVDNTPRLDNLGDVLVINIPVAVS